MTGFCLFLIELVISLQIALPTTFMGFSSVGFDDEILRREFFKSLRKPYLINTAGCWKCYL